MSKQILDQNKITTNEATFIASDVLNGRDSSTTLDILKNKDTTVKDSVINSLGASLTENPNVISTLSPKQRKELANFVRNNPPQGRGEDFSYQNEQWNNILNLLDSNMTH